jgi:hypothetical protein
MEASPYRALRTQSCWLTVFAATRTAARPGVKPAKVAVKVCWPVSEENNQ